MMKDKTAVSRTQETYEAFGRHTRRQRKISYRKVQLEAAHVKTVGKKEQNGNEQSSKGWARCNIYGERGKK